MTRPNRTTPLRSVAATILGLAWLSACMSPSPPAPSASGGEPSPPSACAPIDLRSPSGASVDLTGRWRSPDDGTYYLRQAGSCVWFAGFSSDTPAPGGVDASAWTNSFFGNLASDFTLRGSWADLPWGEDDGVGQLGWQIVFAEVDGQEAVTLNVIEVTGGFGANFLVVPEASEDLQVRLQFANDCLTVVADDGTDYELASLPDGWVAATPPSLYGPEGEVIRLSDAFELSGESARGSASCGDGLIMFADQIEVSAAP